MSDFELPIFSIVDDRPVMALATDEGGMDILAFDEETGEFERDMSYLTAVVFGDADRVTEEEFIEYVERLRQEG